MPDSDNNNAHEYKIERFKFVLQQIDKLNSRFQKYIVVYQSLATAVAGAIAGVVVYWKQTGIDAESTRTIVRGLVGIYFLLTIFFALYVIAGITAWFNYRNEEATIMNREVGNGYRHYPKLSQFWKWHETYLLLFLTTSTAVIALFMEYRVIPLIN